MPKYGSSSIFYLVGGRSLLGAKPKTLSYKITAKHEEATGLGDTVMLSLPTGISSVMLEQGGAFFDTTSLHDVLRDVADSVQETADVVCAGFGGDTLGQPFVGFEGVYKAEYDVLAQIGNLTKANTKYIFNGAIDDGVILHPLAARTVDTTGTGVDNTASSANGGAAYLQVTAFSGLTSAVITVEHSSDGSTWATKGTFTTVTAGPTAERIALAGTINRHTRYVLDVTGTGSITLFVGLARN